VPRLRSHLSYANVIATVALFVALGGSSYAALKVTGKNVKNSSLSGADIKNNSVTGKDVKGLGRGDFKKGTLLAGATGPQGQQGLTGAPGSALAFGRVDEDGTLSLSKNVVGVTVGSGAAGSYCIDLAVSGARNITANLTFGADGDANTVVAVGTSIACPDNTDVLVSTYQPGGLSPQPFFFTVN
jgi:hypothetical protein